MSVAINYRYHQVGASLVEAMAAHVEREESFILLGYQGAGKREALSMLCRRLEEEGRIQFTIPFQGAELIESEEKLMETLNDCIHCSDSDFNLHPLRQAINPEEWFEILCRITSEFDQAPLLNLTSLDGVADYEKDHLLSLVRKHVQSESDHLVAVITGEGILARRLASDTSPFVCPFQFVVSGFDRSSAQIFFQKRVVASQLIFRDSSNPDWNDETAFDTIFSHTGGNPSILRSLLWVLSERRFNFGGDLDTHSGYNRRELLNCLTIYNNIPLYWLRVFHRASDIVKMDRGALALVERLISQFPIKRKQEDSIETSWFLATIEAEDDDPTMLELGGFLIRNPRSRILRFPSRYAANFAWRYFHPRCLGDLNAQHGQWEKAYAHYDKVPRGKSGVRPFNLKDYQHLLSIVGQLCRAFSDLVSDEGAIEKLETLLKRMTSSSLGLRNTRIVHRRSDGNWRGDIPRPDEVDYQKFQNKLIALASGNQLPHVGTESEDMCEIYTHLRYPKCALAILPTADQSLTEATAILIEYPDRWDRLEVESLHRRILENIATPFLTAYRDAELWQRQSGTRVRLAKAVDRIFRGTNVKESITSLGNYLHEEFGTTGVRLFEIDPNNRRYLKSSKSWGLKNEINRKKFDNGKIKSSRDENPLFWEAIADNAVKSFQTSAEDRPKVGGMDIDPIYIHPDKDQFGSIFERKPGDYWIDFPLFVDGEPYGKLTLGFSRENPPPRKHIDDLEFISKILDQNLARLESSAVALAATRASYRRALRTASHDLLNQVSPLNLVRARYLALAESRHLSKAELENLNEAFTGCLKNSLEVLESTKKRLQPIQKVTTQVNLVSCARELLSSLPALSTAKANAKVVPEGEESLYTTEADEEHLKNCLRELAANSLTMFPGDSSTLNIRVEFKLNGTSEINIVYKDNGPGVPIHLKDKIFEDSFTHRPNGSPNDGLGLAHVRDIIQAHEGSIKENSQPGSGARFIITLPIKPARKS